MQLVLKSDSKRVELTSVPTITRDVDGVRTTGRPARVRAQRRSMHSQKPWPRWSSRRHQQAVACACQCQVLSRSAECRAESATGSARSASRRVGTAPMRPASRRVGSNPLVAASPQASAASPGQEREPPRKSGAECPTLSFVRVAHCDTSGIPRFEARLVVQRKEQDGVLVVLLLGARRTMRPTSARTRPTAHALSRAKLAVSKSIAVNVRECTMKRSVRAAREQTGRALGRDYAREQ